MKKKKKNSETEETSNASISIQELSQQEQSNISNFNYSSINAKNSEDELENQDTVVENNLQEQEEEKKEVTENSKNNTNNITDPIEEENKLKQENLNSIQKHKIRQKMSIFEDLKSVKDKDEGICDIFKKVPVLFRNLTFTFCVLALTALFFVITVIQFWGSNYMENVLKIPKEEVFISFVVLCITGPTAGVIIGGIVTSCIGGYEKKNAMLLCCFGAFMAVACCIPAPFVNDIWSFSALIWFVLFFGGMVLPAIIGMRFFFNFFIQIISKF